MSARKDARHVGSVGPATERRKEYTVLAQTPGCIVTTVEIVTPADEPENLTEALQRLNELNAAGVIAQTFIAENFNDASSILTNRELKQFIGRQ